jgi:putative transposase
MSKFTINYCLKNYITAIVIGNNQKWKQKVNIGNINNQNFINIPYEKYINQLTYKGRRTGINVVVVEESYTSKASFIDNDNMIGNNVFSGKRIFRGLYQSNNNILINADCNGSYNIIRKAFPKAFVDGIEGVHLHPVKINVG